MLSGSSLGDRLPESACSPIAICVAKTTVTSLILENTVVDCSRNKLRGEDAGYFIA